MVVKRNVIKAKEAKAYEAEMTANRVAKESEEKIRKAANLVKAAEEEKARKIAVAKAAKEAKEIKGAADADADGVLA